MSDSEMILWLTKQVDELRAENAGLQEIIFRQQGLMDEKIIVPEAAGAHVGKEPWYIQRQKLERIYRRNNGQTVSNETQYPGMSEEEIGVLKDAS
jgi:hypothetical protein